VHEERGVGVDQKGPGITGTVTVKIKKLPSKGHRTGRKERASVKDMKQRKNKTTDVDEVVRFYTLYKRWGRGDQNGGRWQREVRGPRYRETMRCKLACRGKFGKGR